MKTILLVGGEAIVYILLPVFAVISAIVLIFTSSKKPD
jgi:hypothetical protein